MTDEDLERIARIQVELASDVGASATKGTIALPAERLYQVGARSGYHPVLNAANARHLAIEVGARISRVDHGLGWTRGACRPSRRKGINRLRQRQVASQTTAKQHRKEGNSHGHCLTHYCSEGKAIIPITHASMNRVVEDVKVCFPLTQAKT
ncbi:hypothetical protein [Candidatus Competibacter phosphatis]|uniref:hypothetical protein n=1 Tax=Candidatus Competibacter phosphatis TaxID=221280 RepID=UPI001FEC8C7C|nr:hypothetical protein [Candidatus Competibacter phosphatis]